MDALANASTNGIISAQPPAGCGVERFLVLLDGPWATLIVRELLHGPRRFTDLKDSLPGISSHTLTRRLRRFEAYRIVTRLSYSEVPPRVEYELTALGLELTPILMAMAHWAMSVADPDPVWKDQQAVRRTSR